jgi:uncharacterized protein YegP (UPF0339 family)
MAGYQGKRRQRCLLPVLRQRCGLKIPQTERITMAGMFELFVDAESAFRFRLTASDGTIMAVSKPFDTKTDAVAGIAAVREYAGMGLITDHCTTSTNAAQPAAWIDAGGQTDDYPRMPKIDFHVRARAVRRAVSGPRWAGAIHNLS